MYVQRVLAAFTVVYFHFRINALHIFTCYVQKVFHEKKIANRIIINIKSSRRHAYMERPR